MTLARLIQGELDRRGIRTLRRAAQVLGISGELTRRILRRDLVPKDRTIVRIASALEMEPSVLLLAAHRQRLPRAAAAFMLDIALPASGEWKTKRRWPLSQEQWDYLSVLMQAHEIQLIRKYRQLTPEERLQVLGFINYQFETSRVPPPSPQPALDVRAAT